LDEQWLVVQHLRNYLPGKWLAELFIMNPILWSPQAVGIFSLAAERRWEGNSRQLVGKFANFLTSFLQ